MNRLAFRLPEFTRLAWVSTEAREVWQPRIEQCSAVVASLEVQAVVAGLRACALQAVAPESLDDFAAQLEPHGLVVAEVERIRAQSSYSSAQQPPQPGEPFQQFVAVGAPDAVEELVQAWRADRHEDVGRLLGYPSCCVAFFRDVWIERGHMDTTWPMLSETNLIDEHVAEVTGPPQANILLRWLGVRAVSHLPCRFDCAATVEVADRTLALGRENGLDNEVAWLLEMLSWPVEWTALHGIAEIRTPVVKITASTDATAEKLTIRRLGEVSPEHGARGLSFPYQLPTSVPVTLSSRFSAGIANPIATIEPGEDTTFVDPSIEWTDNGFASEQSLRLAHAPVVDAVRRLPVARGRVLDLGCGNGRLLDAICEAVPDLEPHGVDIGEEKIERARGRFVGNDGHFVAGDLFDVGTFPWNEIDVAILMVGRLLEVDVDRSAALRKWLAEHVRHLVVYSYESDADLDDLCRSAGLTLTSYDDAHAVGTAEPT